ncbi:proton-coupled folate transporter-like isoform X2 [Dreissena polymorpha]|uniref:proton-coupled folate transporter-like isoform X2 n=1 Tax=Dreissena polymorpha TaxID=45954 RepID=UPI002264D7A3|nr:proton-coupled folate transporter-like isoform X2 [Dreissena polymorpha]
MNEIGGENEPLLVNGGKSSDCLNNSQRGTELATKQRKSRVRNFLVLGVIVVIFKGSEQMTEVTLKQFIYAWCKENPDVATGNDSVNVNSSDCTATKTASQRQASTWELYLNLVRSILIYFSVSFAGTLSDYVGRKPFLYLSVAGYALRSGILSIVIYFNLNIAWLYLANVLDGLCGSIYTITLLTYTCAADMTDRSHERVFGLVVMETFSGLGLMSTQYGNGYLIQNLGFFYPMITSLGGILISLILSYLFLFETNDQNRIIEEVKKNITFSKSLTKLPAFKTLLKNYTSFYVRDRTSHERQIFWVCIITFLLTEFCIQSRSDPLTLYQLGAPFCWGPTLLGLYNMTYIGTTMIVACFILKAVQRCVSDPVIACFGLLSALANMMVTALVTSNTLSFIAIGVGFASVLPKPILRGIASSRASSRLQDT